MPKGEYLQYGGQALMEGVMMRSPRYFSVACRAPNGQILVETEAIDKTWIGRQNWLKLPFLRGTLALLDAIALGAKAMRFSTNVQLDERYQPESEDGKEREKVSEEQAAKDRKIQDAVVFWTLVLSFVFAVLLFDYAPNAIAEQLRRWNIHDGRIINVATECTKLVMLGGYVALISRMKEIKEVFKYHGAEHKAINTLEADEPLTMENCKKQTRLHPRCGTSFAVIVLILGFCVFPFVPRYPVTGHQGNMLLDVSVRTLLEILILPIIASVAYELIRLAGKFRNQGFVMALFKPGLLSQYVTTREPTEEQIEVALTALKACIEAEEHGLAPAKAAEPEMALEAGT